MGEQILKKLKFLDVSHSYYLRGTPDFSEINNLEVLVLNNCTSLVEIHKSVICLDKLVTFDLADCKSLKNLPQEIDQFMSRVTRLQFKSPPRITHVDRHLTHIEKVHQHMVCLSHSPSLFFMIKTVFHNFSIFFVLGLKILTIPWIFHHWCSGKAKALLSSLSTTLFEGASYFGGDLYKCSE